MHSAIFVYDRLFYISLGVHRYYTSVFDCTGWYFTRCSSVLYVCFRLHWFIFANRRFCLSMFCMYTFKVTLTVCNHPFFLLSLPVVYLSNNLFGFKLVYTLYYHFVCILGIRLLLAVCLKCLYTQYGGLRVFVLRFVQLLIFHTLNTFMSVQKSCPWIMQFARWRTPGDLMACQLALQALANT